MSYNVVDLIDKTIAVAKRSKEIYFNIEKKTSSSVQLKIMSTVFIKATDKTIDYYNSLKEELKDIELEDIDFVIYDKLSFTINEYNKKTYNENINTIKEYLNFSLELQKDMLALLLALKGRLVVDKASLDSNTYKILSKIIDNKTEQVKMMEDLSKKY